MKLFAPINFSRAQLLIKKKQKKLLIEVPQGGLKLPNKQQIDRAKAQKKIKDKDYYKLLITIFIIIILTIASVLWMHVSQS